MLGYSNLRNYLSTWLDSLGYSPLPTFNPGPGSDPDAIDVSPGRLVLLSIGSGAGLSVEYAFDRPGIQLRTAGLQGDYSDAETFAYDCDRGFLMIDHSQYVDGVWTTSIVRSGGGPALLEKDSAGRFHFTCNYIAEAAMVW